GPGLGIRPAAGPLIERRPRTLSDTDVIAGFLMDCAGACRAGGLGFAQADVMLRKIGSCLGLLFGLVCLTACPNVDYEFWFVDESGQALEDVQLDLELVYRPGGDSATHCLRSDEDGLIELSSERGYFSVEAYLTASKVGYREGPEYFSGLRSDPIVYIVTMEACEDSEKECADVLPECMPRELRP
ncbi:MAG: hypothetical protein AAFX94_00655, partial [Myxococcota bacterium]